MQHKSYLTTQVRIPTGSEKSFLFFPTASKLTLGLTQPNIQWALYLGVKWTGREADHSLSSRKDINAHGVVFS